MTKYLLAVFLPVLLSLALIPRSLCFSIESAKTPRTPNNNNNIKNNIDIDTLKSAIRGNDDATTVPLHDLRAFPSTDESPPMKPILYASDFVPRQEMSRSAYDACSRSRHADCIDLFDGYTTQILRCEALPSGDSLNVRWKAEWIPLGSKWLYDLADIVGWRIEKRCPDPERISMFRWRSVFDVFANAFRTGNITLPVSTVEGNTFVGIDETRRISLEESIDLVDLADAGRLQNRRVAQELASWLDVSRRPPEDECGIDPEEWAGSVRLRVLAGVPGAGALDVDPNEDDDEAVAALVCFGAICLIAIKVLYDQLLAPEVVSMSCEDAARIYFGSANSFECGP